ncbi:MAG TPA: hypothetical protein VHZ76_01030 [Gammaproteobacteria bacterium]|jgi:adenosylhomocysteinase|nr:hypothetical protein [Gammaproteobacteria bacterium]
MINFSPFETLHYKYPDSQIPFLKKELDFVLHEKIYSGLKILHNTPLTTAALLKVEILALGGAEITVSCISTLTPENEAIEILKSANVKIQIDHNFKEQFDFHLDCCGELIDILVPKIGAVELTQTGTQKYKIAQLEYPVISVDDSKLKILETFMGTGDGFVRAIHELFGNEIYGKKFVLFGFGKVGKGIAYALKEFTENIIVIDIKKAGFLFSEYVTPCFICSNEVAKIRKTIKDAYCVVTSTGHKEIMSNFYNFTKKDFGEALLANMGAEDEYGQNFTNSETLFDKQPLNFLLPEPTKIRYLDPVFYAHNRGVNLIMGNKLASGYSAFPSSMANDIINKWQAFHKESIMDIGGDGF